MNSPPFPFLRSSTNQAASETNIITFGKYSGQTYEFVKANDVAYCNWILKQINASGRLFHFQQWIKSCSQKKVTCECCNGTGLVDAI